MHWIKRTVATAIVLGAPIGVAAPAMQVHAAPAAQHRYVIHADFVLGAEGAPKGGPVCVANAVFHPGEQVVWRAVFSDAATGKPLTKAQIAQRGVTASVMVQNGPTVKMQYAAHPPAEAHPKKQAFYWTGAWKIGKAYPMGPVTWTIQLKDTAGGKASFAPIGQDVGIPSIIIAPAGGKAPAPAQ